MALFLTVEEFGEAMHLKHSQAYYLLASGRAPSVRINGRRLVPKPAFDTWYDEQVRLALAAVKPEPVRSRRRVRMPDAS